MNNARMLNWSVTLLIGLAVLLGGCLRSNPVKQAAPAKAAEGVAYDYRLGAGDRLNIFVWRNPDVSVADIPVRPDGKLSSPLVEDMPAAGKTPSELARDIEKVLANYIKEPFVTVTVMNFVGGLAEQVRVVGEAAKPQALPYRRSLTVLDVMIAAGGLTEFADGNKASIVRTVDGKQQQIGVRLDDLLKDGDIDANVEMAPGDILVIPESVF